MPMTSFTPLSCAGIGLICWRWGFKTHNQQTDTWNQTALVLHHRISNTPILWFFKTSWELLKAILQLYPTQSRTLVKDSHEETKMNRTCALLLHWRSSDTFCWVSIFCFYVHCFIFKSDYKKEMTLCYKHSRRICATPFLASHTLWNNKGHFVQVF